MLNFEVVADDGNPCGEGPVWDGGNACLCWTDIAGRNFYPSDWRMRRRARLRDNFEISGFTLDEAAAFEVANSSGVWRREGTGDTQLTVNRIGDEACRLNDSLADPPGKLLAGTCWYEPGKSYRPGKLICVDCDGGASVLDEGFHLSNGLGASPDCKSLYFTDSVGHVIYEYDYDAKEGSASKRTESLFLCHTKRWCSREACRFGNGMIELGR